MTATRHTVRLLDLATDSPVQPAFTAAADPRVPAAVAALRARHPGRRVAVAPYLLAPGMFADTVATAPADLVSAPLGAHAELADLILRRYDEARARLLVSTQHDDHAPGRSRGRLRSAAG